MRRSHLVLLLVLIASATLAVLTSPTAFARRKRHAATPSQPPVTAYELAKVEAPKPNEVCFSPEEPCGEKLIKFVQGAQKSLDLAIYDINLDQLVHTLAVAARQMPVRVVVDQRQSKGEHSLVATLVKVGVNVRFGRQRGIMHNKFVIRDGSMLETGSFNFTNHASMANNENQIYLDRPDVLARYRDRFEHIWAAAKLIPGSADLGGPDNAAGGKTSGPITERAGQKSAPGRMPDAADDDAGDGD